MNGMFDQAGCRSIGPEFLPAVHRSGTVIDISMGSSAVFSTPCEDSGGNRKACTSAFSLLGLQQQSEVCEHAADPSEITSAVLRSTTQSAANMNDMFTESLSFTETPARRQNGRSTGRGNKRRNAVTSIRDNKRQT